MTTLVSSLLSLVHRRPGNGRRLLPHARRPNRWGGFTLIEIMVVLIIIAGLAALLLPALQRALARARETAILVEINQLGQALENFKQTYGDYPPVGFAWQDEPSSTRQARVRGFIQRAFPRYSAEATEYNQVVNTLANLTPAESMVFWLGGMPTGTAGTTTGGFGVEGFSKDPSRPFYSTNAGSIVPWRNVNATQRTTPFFQFDPTRLSNVYNRNGTSPTNFHGFWEYKPEGLTAPYVYFRASEYVVNGVEGRYNGPTGMGTAVAYRATTGNALIADSWASPRTFQIICAGVDNMYGDTGAITARLFPSGQGYGVADDDNLTNFSTTGNLGSMRQ